MGPSKRVVRWDSILSVLAGLAVAGLACSLVLGWTGEWFFPGEIVANLRYPAAVAGSLVALVGLLARRPRLAGAAAVLALWHAWPDLALWRTAPQPPAHGPQLRVGAANLLYGSADPTALERWLERSEIDLLALTEVQESNTRETAWREVFEDWRPRFPHQERICGEPGFDMVLLSRWPIRDLCAQRPAADGAEPRYRRRLMLAEATVEVGGRSGIPVRVVIVHPPPPRGRWSFRTRRQLFHEVAEIDWDGPLVLLGDLNCTGTSPLFRELVRAAGLRDSRQGFGPCGSWKPPRLPGHWVAIDHVLVRGGIAVERRTVGPEIGSDHLPIHADLRLPGVEEGP